MALIVRILLPKFPESKNIFFKGYVTIEENSIKIFITDYSTENCFFKSKNDDEDVLYGYYTPNHCHKIQNARKTRNYLLIENIQNIEIKELLIHNKIISKSNQFIILFYDYDRVKNSETIYGTDDFISKLKYFLKKEEKCFNNVSDYTIIESPIWLSSSMFIKHVFNYFNLIGWLLFAKRRKEKVSIQQGNLILAILVDVVLGYFLLGLLTFDTKEVASSLVGALEKLVNLMYSLLKWLMGAPAGLKLNNAFNKMLGKYFLYHVELWWLFLDITCAKLDIVLHIFQYLGYLGLTFQAAIISDMICLATFHSYCIYIYAARLFNIQISGLIALMRLFVGRKYNPLRGGIDSCEYTNQELFVGTVAFTILLLLLPTTLMYYIVFTMFRILSLLVQFTLAKLIYVIQCTPFYVFILWATQSSKIAGNVFIEEVSSNSSSKTLVLHVKLLNKSIKDLMLKFKPPVDTLKNIEWTNVAKNVFTGKQII